MVPFAYTAVADPISAIRRAAEGSGVEFIAGGTDMLQLLQEGVRAPIELVDINGIGFDDVSVAVDGVRIGAMARLSDVADDVTIRERVPVVAEALQESASPRCATWQAWAAISFNARAAFISGTPPRHATSGSLDQAARLSTDRTGSTPSWAVLPIVLQPIRAISPSR